MELNETWLNYLSHLVVAKRFCGTCVAKRHRIPVVISLSFRVVLLMFTRSSEFPGEERRCDIGLCDRYWSGCFFLVVISQETAVSGGSCGMESDNFCRLSLLSRSAIFNMLCCCALQCAVRLNGWFCRLLCSVVVKVDCFVIDLIC